MTKQDVADWKRHPVTQEIFLVMQERAESLRDEIAGSAHTEEMRVLAHKAGYLQSLYDILDTDY